MMLAPTSRPKYSLLSLIAEHFGTLVSSPEHLVPALPPEWCVRDVVTLMCPAHCVISRRSAVLVREVPLRRACASFCILLSLQGRNDRLVTNLALVVFALPSPSPSRLLYIRGRKGHDELREQYCDAES